MSHVARPDERSAQAIRAHVASLPELALNCVHLWQLDLPSAERVDESDFVCLTSSERDRAAKLCLESDRRTFSFGRATLRTLLGAYLRRSPRMVAIAYGAHGKPHLEPRANPGELQFSVAHSRDRFLYAVTRARAIGVDVQRLRRIADLPSFARAVLTAHELRNWYCLQDGERAAVVFRDWVRKEAILKSFGYGLAVRPSRIDVTHASGTLPATSGSAGGPGGHRSWRLLPIDQNSEWVAALALQGSSDAAVISAGFGGVATR